MNRFVRIALSLALPALVSAGASAAPFLPGVQNLNFVDYTGSAPKGAFTTVAPTGWVGGGGLIYVDGPGSPGCNACADGPVYLQTYGPFPNPPLPGNYVEADGNPDYEGSFSQTITGLTVGQTYTLSFYQAGSQQTTFANGTPTTQRWIVSLGTVGNPLMTKPGGPTDPLYGATALYYSNDPSASIAESQMMTTPSGSYSPWEYVSVDLTADASTQLLSFLAWGDNGSTINLPPIVFLSGVNSPNVLVGAVPEPATLGLLGIVAMGAGVLRLRRRKSALHA